MAAESAAPLNPADEKHRNPDAEIAQPKNEVQEEQRKDVDKQASVFVDSEPMREEQVQNAVKFLSHPRVRNSPVIYRRSFLEKKGLTKEEIDEAFRRVPDPPPTMQTATDNQDGMVKSSSNIQSEASAQTLQAAAVVPTGVVSSVGTLTRSRFHWSHAILAVGLLAITGAGTAVIFKNSIVPRLKSWIRKVVLDDDDDLVKKTDSKQSLMEVAAVAAKAAAAAASDVAKVSQEMLYSKNEEGRKVEELVKLLDLQLQEMKLLTKVIQRFEDQRNVPGRAFIVDQEDHRVTVASSKPYVNGSASYDLNPVISSSPFPSVEPSVALHPKSYMDIMAMIQRGEKPSNIRDINDLPPNPNQQPSNPRLAPRPKPWEVGQAQSNSSPLLQSQGSGSIVHNGSASQLNSNNLAPWWQQKNVRMSEIENNDNPRAVSYGRNPSETLSKRTWVPPQPPPVAMPEAAEAIRRSKSTVQKEQLADNQSMTRPETTEELQGVTKVSESGGAGEIINSSSGMDSSEIRVE